MRTAIFLGAGASKADGAPLQYEIFKEYFKMTGPISQDRGDNDIQEFFEMFFEKFFNLKIDYNNLDNLIFPSFEEVLSIIDISEKNNDIFLGCDFSCIPSGFTAREIFIYLIAHTLKEKLNSIHKTCHRQLIQNLGNNIFDITFLSTNYDILIDNAVGDNYEVQYFNRKKNKAKSIEIYKLHGSLNWLYCPVCHSIETFSGEKRASMLGRDKFCEKCSAEMKAIIIPPTYFKNYDNFYLQSLWHNAGIRLREIEHIIFCGYSFPEADAHIKYLIKNAQINKKRNGFAIINPLKKITIINRSNEIKVDSIEEQNNYLTNRKNEIERYTRFFGKDIVNFTTLSFEDFCKNPYSIINFNNNSIEEIYE